MFRLHFFEGADMADIKPQAEIFVGLCDWFLVRGDVELLSSDSKSGDYTALNELIGRSVADLYEFPEMDEIHITFDDGLRLEIASAAAVHGTDQALVTVHSDKPPWTSSFRDGVGWKWVAIG
jgi:hypothetical protein